MCCGSDGRSHFGRLSLHQHVISKTVLSNGPTTRAGVRRSVVRARLPSTRSSRDRLRSICRSNQPTEGSNRRIASRLASGESSSRDFRICSSALVTVAIGSSGSPWGGDIRNVIDIILFPPDCAGQRERDVRVFAPASGLAGAERHAVTPSSGVRRPSEAVAGERGSGGLSGFSRIKWRRRERQNHSEEGKLLTLQFITRPSTKSERGG